MRVVDPLQLEDRNGKSSVPSVGQVFVLSQATEVFAPAATLQASE